MLLVPEGETADRRGPGGSHGRGAALLRTEDDRCEAGGGASAKRSGQADGLKVIPAGIASVIRLTKLASFRPKFALPKS
nr:hypothetical protein Ade03nite_76300 [Actinoplanes derwentensis]